MYTEIIRLFFKLGISAFGGPAAHIAMMEEEFVSKRKWMSREHFLDLMGATNLIPGPNSTEMVMHLGLHRAGLAGMILAGASFILPAAFLTLLLAVFYVAYGDLPEVEPFLRGIKPAVLVIILAALIKLGKKALKKQAYIVLGIAVTAAGLWGLNEVFAILFGGLIGMIAIQTANKLNSVALFTLPILSITQVSDEKLLTLFLSFLKIGAILFGSGYVLVAYLEGELIENLGWLTQQQLLDAIAAGQFTPGPVLTTATFVGYQVGSYWGALLATLGIFLPSFCFVYVLNPLIPKLRSSEWSAAFLDAVNVSALGIMAAVLISLTQQSIFTPFDWRALLILAVGAIMQFGPKKIGAPYIVFTGAVLGWFLTFI
ncbi:MAG: chromate efflux transporter [Bacteroidota bacterium]